MRRLSNHDVVAGGILAAALMCAVNAAMLAPGPHLGVHLEADSFKFVLQVRA